MEQLSMPSTTQNDQSLGTSLSFLATIFGCWHKRLSRPFSNGNQSYRVCIECGARRKFDPATFKTSGKYYAPTNAAPHSPLIFWTVLIAILGVGVAVFAAGVWRVL